MRAAWLIVTAAALAALAPPLLLAPRGGADDNDVVEVHLVATDNESQPFAFRPMELEIGAGETVRWVNDEDVFHTVTSTDSLEKRRDSGDFGHSLSRRNETWEHRFEAAGTFHYFCQPHSPFMFGTVTVTGGEERTPAAGALSALGALAAAALALAPKRG